MVSGTSATKKVISLHPTGKWISWGKGFGSVRKQGSRHWTLQRAVSRLRSFCVLKYVNPLISYRMGLGRQLSPTVSSPLQSIYMQEASCSSVGYTVNEIYSMYLWAKQRRNKRGFVKSWFFSWIWKWVNRHFIMFIYIFNLNLSFALSKCCVKLMSWDCQCKHLQYTPMTRFCVLSLSYCKWSHCSTVCI